MRVMLLCAVVALAGCEKPIEEMGYAERKELAGVILDRCIALGLPPNSPEMSQCLAVEVEKERSSRIAGKQRRIAAGQAAAVSMQNYGASMQRQAEISQSRRINCTQTTNYNGGFNTTCY